MNKTNVLQHISRNGIIVIIRTSTIENTLRITNACIDGGINTIEVSMTSYKPLEAVEQLLHKFDSSNLILGAGTVLDSETARTLILLGVKYIISPSLNTSVANICSTYNITYIPGVMTLNEINEAVKLGIDTIKLFPADFLNLNMVSTIKNSFPNLNIIPTGGINLDNLNDWFSKGIFAAGIGTKITGKNDTKYATIVENCSQFKYKISNIKKTV